MVLDANTYLNSLGIDVTDAAQPVIGRLALAGEFVLAGDPFAAVRLFPAPEAGRPDRHLDDVGPYRDDVRHQRRRLAHPVDRLASCIPLRRRPGVAACPPAAAAARSLLQLN